ncbi:MAG: peptidoglycan-associated lipoprotein [Halioglobus sp.]|jgi:peptidoglycan-associated lipoprotein
MKNIAVAGKALTLIFAAVFLVACSSNDTKEADEAAAAAAAAAQAAEQAAASEQQAAASEQAAEVQRLQDAVATVGNVFYFEYDSSMLTPSAKASVDAHIALLNTNERTIRLEGHTDERGTRDYNMALGERRANAVRDYMAASGVANYRVESVSYGEEQPIAYGSGESNWSQNRRVELK